MIGILDYGMGNLGSVANACAFLDLPARIVASPGDIAGCRGLILPGQGAFGDCMRHLRDHGFVEPVRAWLAADRPLLGICIGIQVLAEESEESPGTPGLGVVPGRVRKFPAGPGRKVPQMGWNRVRLGDRPGPFFRDVPPHAFFYFVHSYYLDTPDAGLTAGTTEYGVTYTSAIRRGRMAATQFHPEKSQRAGLQVLRNFGAIAREG